MGKWILAVLTAALVAVPCLAGDRSVRDIRLWAAPDSTRVVFDVSSPVAYEMFTLANPDRVVLDLRDTDLSPALKALPDATGAVRTIRSGQRDGGRDLRIVLDLAQPAEPAAFTLAPNQRYGHRLVVDLTLKSAPAAKTVVHRADAQTGLREVVVAIDAGHGGEDPGAIGPRGTREKDVVLAIARRLAERVDREPGMRAVLIRDGDYYVGLRERILKARKAGADLFISIHADAAHNRSANGGSVYALSQNGATSERARWLAERENAADLAGGVQLSNKEDVLASVLLDLSQTATIERSVALGAEIIDTLEHLGPMHKHTVQQAGFAVLKSPDIPSVLVETAFISNRAEELRLRNARHQAKVANAILDGLRAFVRRHPPAGTVLASREYTIARGDTLSDIAVKYGVGIDTLRVANGLDSDMLRVGDTLRIPPTN